METILKLLPYLLCAGIPSFFFIRNNIKKNKELKEARELNKKLVDTEKEKTEIRSKQDEKENDIVNNPSVDHGVMPISSGSKHNHGFRDPCGPDCPAYSGD